MCQLLVHFCILFCYLYCNSVCFCICLDFIFSTHRPFRKGEFLLFIKLVCLCVSFMWVTNHVFVGLSLSVCVSLRIALCVKILGKEIITYSTLCWPEPAQNKRVSLGCLHCQQISVWSLFWTLVLRLKTCCPLKCLISITPSRVHYRWSLICKTDMSGNKL